MVISMESNCNGCNELYHNYCQSNLMYSITKDGKKIYCPCLECLIKGMCNTSCEAFTEYCGDIIAIERSKYERIT